MSKSHFELLGDLAQLARELPEEQAQRMLTLIEELYFAWQDDIMRVPPR